VVHFLNINLFKYFGAFLIRRWIGVPSKNWGGRPSRFFSREYL